VFSHINGRKDDPGGITVVADIIKEIFSHNAAFASSRDERYFGAHMKAQHPKITLVCCCDARVHATVIAPDPIDRVFTIETIGNQMASAQGSVDYGVLHLHTPLLLILGHTDCGAVKAFMKGYEQENEAIRRELDHLKETIPTPGTGSFEEALVANVKQNVLRQVDKALERYRALVEEGRLTVMGAVYDFTGEFGKGLGKVSILSVNGKTDPAELATMPQLAGLDLGNCLA